MNGYSLPVRQVHLSVGFMVNANYPLQTGSRNCSICKLYTGLFPSPSGISELDCATTKTDTAERSISIGRESLQVLFVLGALAYF